MIEQIKLSKSKNIDLVKTRNLVKFKNIKILLNAKNRIKRWSNSILLKNLTFLALSLLVPT